MRPDRTLLRGKREVLILQDLTTRTTAATRWVFHKYPRDRTKGVRPVWRSRVFICTAFGGIFNEPPPAQDLYPRRFSPGRFSVENLAKSRFRYLRPCVLIRDTLSPPVPTHPEPWGPMVGLAVRWSVEITSKQKGNVQYWHTPKFYFRGPNIFIILSSNGVWITYQWLE